MMRTVFVCSVIEWKLKMGLISCSIVLLCDELKVVPRSIIALISSNSLEWAMMKKSSGKILCAKFGMSGKRCQLTPPSTP